MYSKTNISYSHINVCGYVLVLVVRPLDFGYFAVEDGIQIFYVNRKASSLWSFLASLKRISSTSDFLHIFSWFNKNILPQIMGRQPQGTKFWCQQKPLVTSVICYKNLFEVWFYTFFMILYIYIATGQGLKPVGDKILISTGTSCHFDHLLQI